jgi:hypothetical protein
MQRGYEMQVQAHCEGIRSKEGMRDECAFYTARDVCPGRFFTHGAQSGAQPNPSQALPTAPCRDDLSWPIIDIPSFMQL